MNERVTHSIACRAVAVATIAMFTLSEIVIAQTPAPATSPPAAGATAPATPAAQDEKPFSQEELDQILAPVALYPDDLLAQVLMASTYPLDIVQADRWVKANPNVKDKALEDALQKQQWDPSVKSLAVLPQVLAMMSEKLDWTQKLGDAFLAQKEEVMATAQKLRGKAVEQGNLKDSKEQKVVTEKTENTTIIKIEPTNPEVVYVPTYNPTVVYGAWPYPAYPPYYYYPPGYVAGAAFLSFTAGVIVGGALWGGCNWGRGDVNVNVNRYNNFNKTNISNGNWQHNSDRRGAVPYRDKGTAQKYNRGQSANAGARDAYRGRDGGGGVGQSARSDLARSGGAGAQNRAGAGGGFDDRGGAGGGGFDRGGAQTASNRDMSGTRNGSAFDSGGSRAQTQSVSNRGSSSMASSRASSGGARASPSAGGARAGGGAPRGGGGGGRGGGGRR